MSEPPHPVDVAARVARAAQVPAAQRRRQAVEIILDAIAMTGPFSPDEFSNEPAVRNCTPMDGSMLRRNIRALPRQVARYRYRRQDVYDPDEPEVRNRAGRDRNTMELAREDLPEFEDCHERVATFRRSLPWDTAYG